MIRRRSKQMARILRTSWPSASRFMADEDVVRFVRYRPHHYGDELEEKIRVFGMAVFPENYEGSKTWYVNYVTSGYCVLMFDKKGAVVGLAHIEKRMSEEDTCCLCFSISCGYIGSFGLTAPYRSKGELGQGKTTQKNCFLQLSSMPNPNWMCRQLSSNYVLTTPLPTIYISE